MITFHGTSKLFQAFDPERTICTGDGKCKFGWGIYLTEEYATAVVYCGKGPGFTAKDHYVYTVEIPEITVDNYFIQCYPVRERLVTAFEKEVGPITKTRDSIIAWGLDFRSYAEEALFAQKYGVKPKSNADDEEAQHLCSRWLYAHGCLGTCWPRGKWPEKGHGCIPEKFNMAMFNPQDTRITKIERVDAEFKPNGFRKDGSQKYKCVETVNGKRETVWPVL